MSKASQEAFHADKPTITSEAGGFWIKLENGYTVAIYNNRPMSMRTSSEYCSTETCDICVLAERTDGGTRRRLVQLPGWAVDVTGQTTARDVTPDQMVRLLEWARGLHDVPEDM